MTTCGSTPNTGAEISKSTQSSVPGGRNRGDFLHVVAAAIFNEQQQVLIARRPGHLHQGGKWEFPGGKVEPGESNAEALKRELSEELGIRVRSHQPLIQVRHRYPDRAVVLEVFKVTRYSGECRSCEGQPLEWVAPGDLPRFEFPVANLPIVKALLLPDRYLITPTPEQGHPSFLDGLETALQSGITLVQLRAPNLKASRYRALARKAVALCHAHGGRLLLNAEPEWAQRLRADGVHLNSARLRALRTRPLSWEYLVAASCHDREEIARANRIGADFVVLSPVKATPDHPGVKPLEWNGFRELCLDAAAPVFALGGMAQGDLVLAKRYGGQGIAAIRGLWPRLEQ